MIYSKNVLFDIRLINSYWYSKEGLMLIDKRQEFPIKIIEDKVIPISENFMDMVLNFNENNKQIEHEIDVSKISNPARHKGKFLNQNLNILKLRV
ncbi:unnamed protein product [Rhizophagus irregularis]|nr:unnamed protein product [Rhizophagus irregularis]